MKSMSDVGSVLVNSKFANSSWSTIFRRPSGSFGGNLQGKDYALYRQLRDKFDFVYQLKTERAEVSAIAEVVDAVIEVLNAGKKCDSYKILKEFFYYIRSKLLSVKYRRARTAILVTDALIKNAAGESVRRNAHFIWHLASKERFIKTLSRRARDLMTGSKDEDFVALGSTYLDCLQGWAEAFSSEERKKMYRFYHEYEHLKEKYGIVPVRPAYDNSRVPIILPAVTRKERDMLASDLVDDVFGHDERFENYQESHMMGDKEDDTSVLTMDLFESSSQADNQKGSSGDLMSFFSGMEGESVVFEEKVDVDSGYVPAWMHDDQSTAASSSVASNSQVVQANVMQVNRSRNAELIGAMDWTANPNPFDVYQQQMQYAAGHGALVAYAPPGSLPVQPMYPAPYYHQQQMQSPHQPPPGAAYQGTLQRCSFGSPQTGMLQRGMPKQGGFSQQQQNPFGGGF